MFNFQEKQRRISELEAKQRVLERSFRKIFRLHQELDLIQKEAEKRNEESKQFVAELRLAPILDQHNNNKELESSQERYVYFYYECLFWTTISKLCSVLVRIKWLQSG